MVMDSLDRVDVIDRFCEGRADRNGKPLRASLIL